MNKSIEELIEDFLSEDITPDELEKLERTLLKEPTLLKEFLVLYTHHNALKYCSRDVKNIQLNHTIIEKMKQYVLTKNNLPPQLENPSNAHKKPFSFFYLKKVHLLAASVILSLLYCFRILNVNTPTIIDKPSLENFNIHNIATYIGSLKATWSNDEKITKIGQRLTPGRYSLEFGQALLTLDKGSQVIALAPVTFKLMNEGNFYLENGKVIIESHVSNNFIIRTPTSIINHLGSIIVSSEKNGASEVSVLDGKAEWFFSGNSFNTNKKVTLSTGEKLFLSSDTSSPVVNKSIQSSSFNDYLRYIEGDKDGRLLAHETFDYPFTQAPVEDANGGMGWKNSWRGRYIEGDRIDLNSSIYINLSKENQKNSISDEYTNGSLFFPRNSFSFRLRELQSPIDFSQDGEIYVSCYLKNISHEDNQKNHMLLTFRPTEDYFDHSVGIGLFGKNRINIFSNADWSYSTAELSEEGYLFILKFSLSHNRLDQMFLKVFPSNQVIDDIEPSTWSLISQPFNSNVKMNLLIVHNVRGEHQMDEIKIGTSWMSVLPRKNLN